MVLLLLLSLLLLLVLFLLLLLSSSSLLFASNVIRKSRINKPEWFDILSFNSHITKAYLTEVYMITFKTHITKVYLTEVYIISISIAFNLFIIKMKIDKYKLNLKVFND